MRRASFPQPETRFEFRVSYGETDGMGVVYYANYLHFFERSRSQWIRERGLSYRDVEERGLFLPVREASCRYVSPARFEDKLLIRAGISEYGRASLRFTYEVWRDEVEGAGKLLSLGETEHACVGPEGRPVRLPDWLKEVFAA